MIRQARYAGSFYDGGAAALRARIEQCFKSRLGPGRLPQPPEARKGDVVGIVSPHAGYIYSGAGAANAFFAMAEDGLPETAVIIGPKHHYGGADVAVDTSDAWETPLGEIRLDRDICDAIVAGSQHAEADSAAHAYEHSLEVQVPFLQFLAGDRVMIAPIAVGLPPYRETEEIAAELGAAIAEAIRDRNAIVIASTDFTHFESQDSAGRKDRQAIAAIEKLDTGQLLRIVNELDISMCGVVPTAIAIEACKPLGAAKAELLSYFTSAETTGDTSQVVGYGALKIVR